MMTFTLVVAVNRGGAMGRRAKPDRYPRMTIFYRRRALASRVVDRLSKAAAQLEDFATGRPGRVAGTYEKSVAGLPYIIACEIVPHGTGEVVAILRVIHTARDWPQETWPSD